MAGDVLGLGGKIKHQLINTSLPQYTLRQTHPDPACQ